MDFGDPTTGSVPVFMKERLCAFLILNIVGHFI